MRLPFQILYGCIFLFLLLFAFIGCNRVAYQAKAAVNYYDLAVEKIEDSHFDGNVIADVKQEVEKAGYVLEVEKDGFYQEQERMQVTLTYVIKVPFLGLSKERKLQGYAI